MGKRGNGEGSITRRKDGLYMARYTVQTATGPKRKTIYGKEREDVAEKLADALSNRNWSGGWKPWQRGASRRVPTRRIANR